MNLFKWTTIRNGETVDVKAHRTWTVRWTSRHGQYSSDTRPEVEVFTTLEDAERFATELAAAFKMVRHTWGTYITVTENK
jgi:hypothetical protein